MPHGVASTGQSFVVDYRIVPFDAFSNDGNGNTQYLVNDTREMMNIDVHSDRKRDKKTPRQTTPRQYPREDVQSSDQNSGRLVPNIAFPHAYHHSSCLAHGKQAPLRPVLQSICS